MCQKRQKSGGVETKMELITGVAQAVEDKEEERSPGKFGDLEGEEREG